MAKVCDICGKRPVYGNSVSHSNNRNRRRWEPNLQRVRIRLNGSLKRAKVCTSCLRSDRVEKA
ncbi:MAG: 50S ribosomal protein L28 [Fidelibacterota bacterium]|nr:50S ribosomal protein L28 [Candidatus Neomarinimicrobiota bacterium]